MSYGSTEAVEDAEDEYREVVAGLIAKHAAELVAARDRIIGDRPRFSDMLSEQIIGDRPRFSDMLSVF